MPRHAYRITAVHVVAPGRLVVAFDDGTEQTVDLGPVLRGDLYRALADPSEFSRVTIDPECGVLVWPCGADFDPGTLHDWPEEGPRMAALAANW